MIVAGLNGMGSNGTPLNGFRMLATDEPLLPHLHQGHPALSAAEPWGTPAVDDLERDKARLEAEIAVAKARAAAARRRAAERDGEVREALRAELAASKTVLSEMDRAHEVTVAMVREAAQVEADRIVAVARRQLTAGTTGAVRADQEGANDVE